MELPLWLFPELHERNMVVPKMPKYFGKRCALPPHLLLLRLACMPSRVLRPPGRVLGAPALSLRAPARRTAADGVCFPLCGGSTRDDLAAEPAGARLREKCPYWFDVGLALAAQCAGEAPFAGLGPMVKAAFLGRYKALLTRAHTAADSEDKMAFLRLLTREERHGARPSTAVVRRGNSAAAPFAAQTRPNRATPPPHRNSRRVPPSQPAVFNAGRSSMVSFQAWRYNTEERLEAAPIVRAMQRRRLTPGDEFCADGA